MAQIVVPAVQRLSRRQLFPAREGALRDGVGVAQVQQSDADPFAEPGVDNPPQDFLMIRKRLEQRARSLTAAGPLSRMTALESPAPMSISSSMINLAWRKASPAVCTRSNG